MQPAVTIIICTFNRAESLRETLDSIGKCTIPADLPAEILVVDNASSDHTQSVAETVALPNMLVRYVHEPRRGKGYAYNTGMAEARGNFFLFTDDDVRVPDNWIDGMCRPIANHEADAVAGGVRLGSHLERPWLKGELRGWVGSTDILDLNRPGTVVGANMAFAQSVLARVPQFDPELGPGALGFFDEALFWHQLVAAGFRCVGRPNVILEHHFAETRLGHQGFEEIARKLGRSWAYMYFHWEHGRIRCAVPRLWMYRILHRMKGIFVRRKADTKDFPRITELGSTFALSIFEEYCQLAKQDVRHYSKHGLVKLRGEGSGQGRAIYSTPARSSTVAGYPLGANHAVTEMESRCAE